MVKNMDKENIRGLMEVIIKEVGIIMLFKDMVNIYGIMEEVIKEIGNIIK
jgi:hypothetical protein